MIPDEWTEAAVQAAFTAGAENAARELGLAKPITWDDLTERDHDHEHARARAALDAALPLIRRQIAADVAHAIDTHVMTWDETTAPHVRKGWRIARSIALDTITNPKGQS